jgi:hypothetical protein
VIGLLRFFRRRPRPVLRGVVSGRDPAGRRWITPFTADPKVPLSGPDGHLAPGDQIEFEVSPRTGHARRVRVYRRARG